MTIKKLVDENAKVGSQIKTARERRGLTATQLSDMLGMKGHSYRRYERGEISLKATLLIEISRHLEMSLDELVGNEPPKSGTRIVHHKIPGDKGTKIVLTIN